MTKRTDALLYRSSNPLCPILQHSMIFPRLECMQCRETVWFIDHFGGVGVSRQAVPVISLWPGWLDLCYSGGVQPSSDVVSGQLLGYTLPRRRAHSRFSFFSLSGQNKLESIIQEQCWANIIQSGDLTDRRPG